MRHNPGAFRFDPLLGSPLIGGGSLVMGCMLESLTEVSQNEEKIVYWLLTPHSNWKGLGCREITPPLFHHPI